MIEATPFGEELLLFRLRGDLKGEQKEWMKEREGVKGGGKDEKKCANEIHWEEKGVREEKRRGERE